MDGKGMLYEGANINRSLLALTNCINILSDKNQSKNSNIFVPFRNSKLTRILKESLDGSKPVMMIVCLSPNGVFVEETINSIKYAEKAKNIKRCESEIRSRIWSKMKVYNEEDYQKRIDDLERENGWLRSMVKSKVKDSVQSLKRTTEFCGSCKKKFFNRNSKEETSIEQLEENFRDIYSTGEEITRLRFNIEQLDQIIKFNDSEINELQTVIDELEEKANSCTPRGQIKSDDRLSLMYEDLTLLADKLEENLDLKEDMITELKYLDSRAENAKYLLKEMFYEKDKKVGKLGEKVKKLGKEIEENTHKDVRKKILFESVSAKTLVKRNDNVEKGDEMGDLETSRKICRKVDKENIVVGEEGVEHLIEELKKKFRPDSQDNQKNEEQSLIKIPKLNFKSPAYSRNNSFKYSKTLKTLDYSNSERFNEMTPASSIPLPTPKSIHPNKLRLKVASIRESLNSKIDKSLTNPMSLISSERPTHYDLPSSFREVTFTKRSNL